jgi:hypothetical protein
MSFSLSHRSNLLYNINKYTFESFSYHLDLSIAKAFFKINQQIFLIELFSLQTQILFVTAVAIIVMVYAIIRILNNEGLSS